MSITVNTSQEIQLNWTAKGTERRVQNFINLINTWRYDVAYNRIMGLNPEIPDKPYATAVALYTADVYRLAQEYAPDITVKSVKVRGFNVDGNIDAEVVIEV